MKKKMIIILSLVVAAAVLLTVSALLIKRKADKSVSDENISIVDNNGAAQQGKSVEKLIDGLEDMIERHDNEW